MNEFNDLTVFLVEYETDVSSVCEYMTKAKLKQLEKEELNGSLRITKHMEIGFAKEA